MAPKRKEHNNDLHSLAIKHFQDGDSQQEIVTKTLLPRETVLDIINEHKRTKCIGNLFDRGQKEKTTTTTDRTIQRILKKDRRTSPENVAAEIKKQLDISLSAQSVRNRAHEIGTFGRVARKKPYANKVNRSKHFKFAKEMLQKPLGFWQTVIWYDESKFELFSSKNRVMVWHTLKETFDPQWIIPTVKYVGDSVTVWGCLTHRGIGKLHIFDRTLDRFYYREILERNLLTFIANFGFSDGFIFMHDNDQKHTLALVKSWLVKQHTKTLLLALYFPDLNLAEHLWDQLERRLKKRQPKDKQELGNLLMGEWNKTEISVLEKLVDSVPSRLYECIRVKGYSIKY